MEIFSSFIETDFCKISLRANDNALLSVSFHATDSDTICENEITKQARSELYEYLQGKRKIFSVPLSFNGTSFQNKVWNELLKIPYGKSVSYKDIACGCGNVKACRAAGGAIHRNPIVIIIPCHRVVGHDGSLTGFGGGLDVKQRLLDLEQICTKQHR
ncbi:MAG: methylated-DNA--[protein]-cysteine S-methyltransferase [Spirochaetaceae bacterium]|jgi:O-6-methylguanine DNA methyltransferase|nr:methylated-DNA--[protein]-cysteine S-methyltransferase [Spirochaetaceae bacterium]